MASIQVGATKSYVTLSRHMALTNMSPPFSNRDRNDHIHIWHGSDQYWFRQKMGFVLTDDEETQHKPSFETSSHPLGTVLALMAGLVVKVLVNNGTKVEKGQPILVLEAMKMEHVLKAPSAGCIHGLQVAAGQQVADSSALFIVKDE